MIYRFNSRLTVTYTVMYRFDRDWRLPIKKVLKLVPVPWQQLTGTHTKGVVKYNDSIGAYGYTCEIKCDGSMEADGYTCEIH